MDVLDAREIYSAQIGSEDGKEKHMIVDYDEISWFYAHTRGIKTDEKLYLEIRDSVSGRHPLLLLAKNVEVDESGVIKVKINWGLIKNKVSFLTVYAVVKENNADGKVLYDADGSFSMATAKLMKSSSLVKEVGYKSAVMVEGSTIEKGKKEEKCPRCEAEITIKDIEDCFGILNQHKAFRQEIVDNLNKYINQRKEEGKPLHLNTCLRKAHFFAQVGAETLGIHPDWMVETDIISYTVKNLMSGLFGNRAVKLKASGNLEIYCKESPQKKLLNYLYADENGFGNGNGNELSGDGYKFRGRGLKQLPGRGNYKTATTFLKDIFPNEYIDLEDKPDKVEEPKYAVLSAIAYWEKQSIWLTADSITESNDENIKKIRKKVNPGLAGWKESKNYFEKGLSVFKVNKCMSVSIENLAVNEFGLVQVTKLGNPYIVNSGTEDSYSYSKKDGTNSEKGKHGDDWMLPEKAKALSDAVYKFVKEYPKQKIYLGDCSAYNPSKNLGHSKSGAHSSGNAFDCQFLKSDGTGSNSIYSLTEDEIKLNARFIELLKETGNFSTFYTDRGKIPGSVHSKGHDNHIHGN